MAEGSERLSPGDIEVATPSQPGTQSHAMRDLSSGYLIVTKGLVFLGLGVVTAGLLFLESPSLRAAVLISVLVWSSCRFYYFLFYVLHNYVDPSFRYAGLFALLGQIRRSRSPR